MNTKARTSTFTSSRTRMGVVAVAAALGLALAGCGSGDDNAAQAPAESSAAPTSAAPATDPTTGTEATDAPTDDTVYKAIDTAIAQLPGAKAYDLELDDNGTGYEIEVTDGTTEREVKVAGDGVTVQGTDDDAADADNAKEANEATVDMKAAIEKVLAQQPGMVTEAEIDRDRDGQLKDVLAWDIEVRDADNNEHEFVVDAASGEVHRDN